MTEILPPKTRLTNRFEQAVAYAIKQHANQVRKETDILYMSHPLGVASIVLEAGGSEDEVIAGLLHDVPEDCGGAPRLAEIKEQFGERVAHIVEACSDTLVENRKDKAPWVTRKQAHLEHLEKTDDAGILLVTAADKLHNARAIVSDLSVLGTDVFGRFVSDEPELQKKIEKVIWYYESVLNLVRFRIDPNVTASLVAAIAKMKAAQVLELRVRHGDYELTTANQILTLSKDDGSHECSHEVNALNLKGLLNSLGLESVEDLFASAATWDEEAFINFHQNEIARFKTASFVWP